MAQRVSSKEDFIEEALEVHEGKYDYSCINYKSRCTPTTFYCPVHNEDFIQSPSSHLHSSGCPKCGAEERIIKKEAEFLREFKNKQPALFKDLKIIKFVTKKEIYFEDEFGVTVVDGAGVLAGWHPNITSAVDKSRYFENKAKSVHGNDYSYSKVVYINGDTNISILCNTCNKYFNQKPNSHMLGKGCKSCNISKAWKKGKDDIPEGIDKELLKLNFNV